MASQPNSRGSLKASTVFSCILLFQSLFFGQILSERFFKQSLWLYFDEDHQGDHRWFEANQPNLDYYSELMPLVKQVCFTGVWHIYSDENYKAEYVTLGSYEQINDDQLCKFINGSDIKSFRHSGASDTEDLGISLYTEYNQKGDVFSSEGEAVGFGNINVTIQSLAATGYSSSYLLFEGPSFGGNYACIPVPTKGYTFAWVNDVQSELNITTVVSLIGGRFCPDHFNAGDEDGESIDLEYEVEQLRQKYRKKST